MKNTTEELAAIDRAARTLDVAAMKSRRGQRLRDALSIIAFVLCIVSAAAAFITYTNGTHTDLVAQGVKTDAAVASFNVASKELSRDQKMIRFFCNDMKWDDQWRSGFAAIELKYHPPAQTSPYFIEREGLLNLRQKHAAVREKACADLAKHI